MSQESHTRGNTNSRARRWCFTLNNYTAEELSHCLSYVESHGYLYCIGEERGEEKETEHLQGYIEFKNQVRFSTLRHFLERAHWEKARGTREQNRQYCSKGGRTHCNLPVPEKELCLQLYEGCAWRDWQSDLLTLVASPPDDRTINWFWDTSGNKGKSFICKYLALAFDAIVADGKANDVYNQILQQYQRDDRSIKIVCLDIPRHQIEYLNYGMLEKIKNGFIYSGKYEGGKCFFRSPHVLVFANSEPDYSKWSGDRFNVVDLNQ